MKYQDSYCKDIICGKRWIEGAACRFNLGKIVGKKPQKSPFGKKREVVEKIINYLARRYEEDLARYFEGKKVERNHGFFQ